MKTINTIGRRKSSVARIYLSSGSGKIRVNGRDIKDYFPTEVLQIRAKYPLLTLENESEFDIKVNVMGGGVSGQADAVKLAVARALCEVDADYKPRLKNEGLLTRDPRKVERKKYGRRKARRSFQFSKR